MCPETAPATIYLYIYLRRHQAALVERIHRCINIGVYGRMHTRTHTEFRIAFSRLVIETCRFRNAVLIRRTIQSTYFMLKLTAHVLKG